MKTTPHKPDSATSVPCFECDAGTLQPVLENHATRHPKLGDVVIPGVPMLRCDHCGDVVIGQEGNARIDTWLDATLNVISPEDIQSFLSKYGLTQKEASRITGLGEKNISRWASGRARPSESVSNLLRLLLAETSAFERLRQKNFT